MGRVSGTAVPNPGWGQGRDASLLRRGCPVRALGVAETAPATEQAGTIASESAHSKAGELRGTNYGSTVIVARRTRPDGLAKRMTETSLSGVSIRGLAGKDARSAAAILSTPAGVVFVAVP